MHIVYVELSKSSLSICRCFIYLYKINQCYQSLTSLLMCDCLCVVLIIVRHHMALFASFEVKPPHMSCHPILHMNHPIYTFFILSISRANRGARTLTAWTKRASDWTASRCMAKYIHPSTSASVSAVARRRGFLLSAPITDEIATRCARDREN